MLRSHALEFSDKSSGGKWVSLEPTNFGQLRLRPGLPDGNIICHLVIKFLKESLFNLSPRK